MCIRDRANLSEYFNYSEAPTLEEKKDFFSKIDVFTMPTDQEEPKGIPVLEALASGLPVVQPDKGVFTNVINTTKGGVLYDDRQPSALSQELLKLLDDPEKAEVLGQTGRENVVIHYSDDKMAVDTKSVYEKLLMNQLTTNKWLSHH